MKNLSKILLFSSLAVLMAVGSASATAYLRFISGPDFVSIEDNGTGDLNSTVGIISFTGTVDSWNVALTGMSKPVIGSLNSPEMDVIAVTSGGASLLWVTFSETFNYHLSVTPSYQMDFAGNADGPTYFGGYWDPGNQPFATSIPLWNNGPFPAGVYDSQMYGTNMDFTGNNAVSIYSMTMVGEFTPGSSVPEPATMLLFGSGLIGLVGFRRKFKK